MLRRKPVPRLVRLQRTSCNRSDTGAGKTIDFIWTCGREVERTRPRSERAELRVVHSRTDDGKRANRGDSSLQMDRAVCGVPWMFVHGVRRREEKRGENQPTSLEDAGFSIKPLFSAKKVEAAGIAPASRDPSMWASTCVAAHLIVGLGSPSGRVPFGLSRHEFNSSRNRRLGSSDPALSSSGGTSGRRPAAKPFLPQLGSHTERGSPLGR